MVQRIAEALPINLQDLVSRQLTQLNTMTVPGLMDAAAITLAGEQYQTYTTVTQNILASPNGGKCFFITGPGGTGKSYLLKAIQHWCNSSRNNCLLQAPTSIATHNIDGNTIHSSLSIFPDAGQYSCGISLYDKARREALN
jgi:ABC-type cobalamin/Fe3+-siderophores transport system ATPase subunit